MDMRRAVPAVVLGLGGILAVAGLINYATGEADYADLVPAPDSIIWEEGQESTVLVSTNLDDVDLRVGSVAMGIESLQGAVPHSGVLMVLGASVGCQDWAVSKLTADAISTGGFTLKGNVDRDNFTSTAQVHFRTRAEGGEWNAGVGSPIDVAYVSGDEAASNRFSHSLSASNEVWEVEASSDDGFPVALTRFITVDTTAGTSTTDEEVESVVLLKDTGVALKACSEHDDVMLTLHGPEGEELNRYVVDVGAPPATPVPTATPVPAPAFSASYQTLRFCPDSLATVGSDERIGLSGGEAVGTVSATGTGTLAYSLAPDGESRDFAFFAIADSTGAITVSDAGADDTTGIDGLRLYTVVVRADDDAGRVGEALVAVQVDVTVESPGGDGACS